MRTITVSGAERHLDGIHSLFGRLKKIIPWSLPIKFGLSVIAGALGGAGLLAYLSEYATYSYAIYYGMRPPLEGVPYLKAAVAFGSAFLLLSGAVLFSISIVLLRLILAMLHLFAAIEQLRERYGKISWKRFCVAYRLKAAAATFLDAKNKKWYVPLLSIIVMVIVFGVIGRVLVLSLDFFDIAMTWERNAALIGLPVYAFIISVLMIFPRALWTLGVVTVVLYFSAWISVLFTPTYYAQLLRLLGYGGGVAVTLHLREDGVVGEVRPKNGYLMMRTSEAIVLLPTDGTEIEEIPRDQVKIIVHKIGGLHKLPFKLPS